MIDAESMSEAEVLRSAFGNSAAESKSKICVTASGPQCPPAEFSRSTERGNRMAASHEVPAHLNREANFSKGERFAHLMQAVLSELVVSKIISEHEYNVFARRIRLASSPQ